MADYLFCNFRNCSAPITECIWVTRCSHVFCENHGKASFLNESSKVKCPACNETNVKETDVIKSSLNPHDEQQTKSLKKSKQTHVLNNYPHEILRTLMTDQMMMLACVKPEKVFDYLINSIKLWAYQMNQKRKISISLLTDKYEKLATDSLSKLRTENAEMKTFIMEIEERLKIVNEELVRTKKRLWKYKMAYKNLASVNADQPDPQDCLNNKTFFSELNSEEVSNVDPEDMLRYRSLNMRILESP